MLFTDILSKYNDFAENVLKEGGVALSGEKSVVTVTTIEEAWKHVEQGEPLFISLGNSFFSNFVYVYKLNNFEYYFEINYTLGMNEFEVIPVNETKNLIKRLLDKYEYGVIIPGEIKWTEEDFRQIMADENFKFKWWQKLLMVFNFARRFIRQFKPKKYRLIEYYLD